MGIGAGGAARGSCLARTRAWRSRRTCWCVVVQVCREYQRGACKRAESECRFAHPPPPVIAHDDGCVTVCMDAVKGRCVRDPCRYFHPPLHLQAHLKAQARGAVRHQAARSRLALWRFCCRLVSLAATPLSFAELRSVKFALSRATLPSHSRFTFYFIFYLSHNITLRRALGVFCASTTSLLFPSCPATLGFT